MRFLRSGEWRAVYVDGLLTGEIVLDEDSDLRGYSGAIAVLFGSYPMTGAIEVTGVLGSGDDNDKRLTVEFRAVGAWDVDPALVASPLRKMTVGVRAVIWIVAE